MRNKRNKNNKKINRSRFYIFNIITLFFIFSFSNELNNLSSSISRRIKNVLNNNLKVKICNKLENDIRTAIAAESSNWSISAISNKGDIFVNINSKKPRIPASNQKLLTTAFTLDSLGAKHRLKTILYKNLKGDYYLIGHGDPDFGEKQIKIISKKISDDNYFRTIFQDNTAKLVLYDIPYDYWWPKDWNEFDKNEYYGSPITRLAINSNSSVLSREDPLYVTRKLFNKNSEYINLNVSTSNQLFYKHSLLDRKVYTIKSASMNSLLSLSNSESHNFTAEILLKNSAKTWDTNLAVLKMEEWLSSESIPLDGFYIRDGSGLSRLNRVTSSGISNLLYKMKNHRNFNEFLGSMSIIGVRGTLSTFPNNGSLDGRFYGKSGTLSGVRTISGYLRDKKGFKVISILTNNIEQPDSKISSIISKIDNSSVCDN